MFYFVEKHRLIITAILGCIALTFVGFGIGTYGFSHTGDNYLVRVGSLLITPQDMAKATDQLKTSNRIAITPAIEQQILNELITQSLFMVAAQKERIVLNDEQLAKKIASISQLQENGQFSQLRYRQLLTSRQETAQEFEEAVRKQFAAEVQLAHFSMGQFVSRQQTAWLSDLFSQKRIVRIAKVNPNTFLPAAQVKPAEIERYYQKQLNLFKVPQATKVDFIVIPPFFSPNSVSHQSIQAYYQQHLGEFEKRRVSHILVQVNPENSQEEKQQAYKTIQGLLKQLQKRPSDFSKLAKVYSQDPTSAKQGGAIGEIMQGMTVKPFEESAFSLKAGQISPIITTQYGYHIIRVDAIRKESLNAAKPLIRARLEEKSAQEISRKKNQLLAKMVRESQPLEAIALAMHQKIEHSNWLTHQEIAHPLFSQPTVLAKILAASEPQKTSDIVRLENGSLLVFKVIKTRKAQVISLKAATPSILKTLKHRKSTELAKQEGQKILKALAAKKSVPLAWEAPLVISLNASEQKLADHEVRRIFTTSAAKLPAYIGFEGSEGAYWLLRIEAIKKTPTKLDSKEKTQLALQLENIFSLSQIGAYIKTLKKNISVVYASK